MITKQQALEFIYELSKEHEVVINPEYGWMGLDPFAGQDGDIACRISSGCAKETFEATVKQFIEDHINTNLFKNISQIPVDVDMLEVGQTYRVEFLDFTGVPNSFTEKLLSITEEDKPVFNFSNGYYTKYIDIKEIYKVSEK